MSRPVMTQDQVEHAAGLLRVIRLDRTRFRGFPPECTPNSEDDAYRVQDALHAGLTRSGWGDLVGYKIGCTTRVMQAYLQIDNPCAGGIFRPTVHHGQARLPRAQFVRVGVECEIAVRLARDLASERTPNSPDSSRQGLRGRDPFTREEVARAVDACVAAIEVVEDRYVDYAALGAPSLIADDFFGAGCVLGELHEGFDPRRLRDVSARMLINGKEVGAGLGTDVMGEPLDALAWLANTLVRRGKHLRAGEFVLLGSLVQTHWIELGDEVLIQNDPLGSASLLLT